nr:hypothetical protein I308_03141 [Cryptococcus tetragattii IND107]
MAIYEVPTVPKSNDKSRKYRSAESQAIIFCKSKDQPEDGSQALGRAGQKATWYNSETGDRGRVRELFGQVMPKDHHLPALVPE